MKRREKKKLASKEGGRGNEKLETVLEEKEKRNGSRSRG